MVAAAQAPVVIDPAALSFAGPSASRIETIWQIRSNPAALPRDSTLTVAASCTPSTSGITGYLEGTLIAASMIDSTWSAGAIIDAAGIDGYRETMAALLAGVRLGSLSFGATLRYHSLAIDHYGDAEAASLDVGVIARLNREIRLGGRIMNLVRSEGELPLPQRIGMGCAFDLDAATTLSIDIAQEIRHPVSTSLAFSYQPLRHLTLRFGAGSFPVSVAAGIGYDAGMVLFDYGGAWSELLGVLHAAGVGVRL
jgi:hypothetical protein